MEIEGNLLGASNKFWAHKGRYLGQFIERKLISEATEYTFEHGKVIGLGLIFSEVAKKYTWDHIKARTSNETAYFQEIYANDFFTAEEVEIILEEIDDEAQHKNILSMNKKSYEDIKNMWPNIDEIVNKINLNYRAT